MRMPPHRPGIAPVLSATADGPHPVPGAAPGVHFITIFNVVLVKLEHVDIAPAAPTAPDPNLRAASGPLIVDGIVLPGLRFGS